MLKIIVINEEDERYEITDMYWFEENGVHSLEEGKGTWGEKYHFEIYVGDTLIYSTMIYSTIDR